MVAERLCSKSPLLLVPDAALSPASHASTEEGFHPRYSEQMRQRFNYEGVLEHKGANCDRAVLQVCFHLVIIMVNRVSSDTNMDTFENTFFFVKILCFGIDTPF